jgi:hypothetical protein
MRISTEARQNAGYAMAVSGVCWRLIFAVVHVHTIDAVLATLAICILKV